MSNCVKCQAPNPHKTRAQAGSAAANVKWTCPKCTTTPVHSIITQERTKESLHTDQCSPNKISTILSRVNAIYSQIGNTDFKSLLTTIASLQQTVISLENDLKLKNDQFEKMETEFDVLKRELEETRQENQQHGERIQQLEDSLNSYMQMDGRMDSEQLHRIITKRDEQIEELELRVCHQEQYSRKNQFEIRELEVRPGESMELIVMNLAQKLNIRLTANDIQAAHRVPVPVHRSGSPRQGSRIPKIIVSLKDRGTRDQIVASRVKVSAGDLLQNDSTRKVYLGASLSAHFRKVLMQAKDKAREKGYQFCWFRNTVRVKKTTDSNTIFINSLRDLEKIV